MKSRTTTAHRRSVQVTAVAAAVVASLSLTACGGGSGGSGGSGGKVKLSFSWWGDASRAKATQDAIAAFEKANPTITVSTQYATFGPYNQKLATQIAGGGAPDLMQIDWGNQSQYAQSNTLLDLAAGPGAVDISGLDPKFAGSGKEGAKQVAIPFGQATQSFVVDVTKLEALGVAVPKAGWTWDDVATFGAEVKAKSGGKLYGISDPGTTWAAFQSWLLQQGKQLYTADGKLGFGKDDLTAFWTMCDNLRKSGAATPANQTATLINGPAEDPLAKGTAAAEWDYDSIFASHAAATKDKLQLVPLPTIGGQTGMYAKPSMLLSVYAKSKHPKEAAKLLSFLVNDKAAGTALGTSRGLFPNTAVRQQLAATATGNDKVVADFEAANASQLAATPAAPPKGDGQLITLMQRIYGGVSFGQQSPEAGAGSFMQQAEQILGS
ncbi:ABC transporter substrate-binding protein [Actinacidiphila bryophytorum]|uniref:Multiple sugar transport system substrate-binding protein n=1 Tax=Actinacidiphila bryophytorum TaxID=1436133 RepID=A0A9W4H3N2_9ACTN|nr:extracellular solute-binding protein [Actinacidiphila bryophytorum]MBM9438169.1 extracellular solute-binding protein [Actinacidiphila bryophytorum]MBN6544639.1 extracellular solute-binding protein [Actinacidiphila bryophytorum]CAG7647709.1 Multiple sugar transport system substrate-binding protein [Actinacidiphila bryophytorum]